MDVEYLRFGEIVNAGLRFDRGVIVDGGGRAPRRKKGPPKAHRDRFGHPFSADEEIPWSASRLVIGTGADGRLPVIPEVSDLAEARGVEPVELPTIEACRLLAARDKEVNAILHVTC